MAKTRHWTIRFPVVALLIIALWAVVAVPASAATVVVANTDDAGAGSLRDAIASATAGDTLDLSSLSGSIVLSTGELVITKDLTITGPGAGSLTIVTITISGNNGRNGGGIKNQSSGDVTITDSTISGNTGTQGGAGIFSNTGLITIINSTFSGNTATGTAPGGRCTARRRRGISRIARLPATRRRGRAAASRRPAAVRRRS